MKYQCKCGHAKSSSKILLNICNKCYSDIDIKIEKEPLMDENYPSARQLRYGQYEEREWTNIQ